MTKKSRQNLNILRTKGVSEVKGKAFLLFLIKGFHLPKIVSDLRVHPRKMVSEIFVLSFKKLGFFLYWVVVVHDT